MVLSLLLKWLILCFVKFISILKRKKDTKQIGTGHLSYLYDDKEVIWEAHWFLEI